MQAVVLRYLNFVEFGSESIINFFLSSKPILLEVGLVIEEMKRLSRGRSFHFFNSKIIQ